MKSTNERRISRSTKKQEVSYMAEHKADEKARKAFKELAYACKASKKKMTLEEYFEARCKRKERERNGR